MLPVEGKLYLIRQDGQTRLGELNDGEWRDENGDFDDSGLPVTHFQEIPDRWETLDADEKKIVTFSRHGVDCPKVKHVGEGYLHGEDDDTPYDVDGAVYCGRCHSCLLGKPRTTTRFA